MFDPSFLICNVGFNMCMHNLHHSLYHYATILFLKQFLFASLRLCRSFSLVYIMIMCAVHIVNALIKQCSKLSCSFSFVIFMIIIISVV